MEYGMIVRYIGVKTEYGITWYKDDTDSAEDLLIKVKT